LDTEILVIEEISHLEILHTNIIHCVIHHYLKRIYNWLFVVCYRQVNISW